MADMTWWQTLIFTFGGITLTKILDFKSMKCRAREEFNKFRKERILDEIESFKEEMGKVYELASNYKSYANKADIYLDILRNDHELIGKYNKYPKVANAARDLMQWCSIIEADEKKQADDLKFSKGEIHEKYAEFIKACDECINSLIN